MNYSKICQRVVSDLPQRQKIVILRRFGLEKKERETLEGIGKDFGITRERVRQIEVDGFERLENKKKDREANKVFSLFASYLNGKGGLKREDLLFADLGQNQFNNEIYFLLRLGDPFHRFPETEKVYPFWSNERSLFQKVGNVLADLIKVFEKEKRPLAEDDIRRNFKKEDPSFFVSSVEVAKPIEKGPLGRYGLVSWPEIKPKGVRDRAYLALSNLGKPLHFREIAVLAGELEGGICPKKEVLPQTVHNELIKDERFVLVGRGVYGLREWGYSPGTVKEVIRNILESSKKSLSREEIVEQVLSQRLVKENTILLNLQDRNLFSRDKQGRYVLRS